MATESDNVNSGALGTLLAVGACATLGIALVVTALVRTEVGEETQKKEVGADRPYRDLVAEQTAKMAAPAAYVDRGRGLVSLPIERAMELTVSNLIKDPNSATPPAVGGSGGASADANALGGSSGAGGTATGGTATATGGTAPDATAAGGSPTTAGSAAVEVAKPPEGSKAPGTGDKPEKKVPPKPAKPTPAAPAPAPAAPAPAPAAPPAP